LLDEEDDAAGVLEALAGFEAGVPAAERAEEEPEDDDLEDEEEAEGVEEAAGFDSILYIEAGAGYWRC